jgi:hypothetical protein
MRFKIRHIAFIVFLLIVAVPVAGFFLLPWQQTLARQLEAVMQRHGFNHVSLSVAALGWHSATLTDISIGEQTPLTLKKVELRYDPAALRNGILRDLELSGLALAAHGDKDGWKIAGLEDYMQGRSDGTPFAFPVTAADLARLPFTTLKIEDSSLSLMTASWRLDMPLSLTFQKSPGAFGYSAGNLAFRAGGAEAETGTVSLSLTLDEKAGAWNGPWTVKGLDVKGSTLIPALDGSGTVTVTKDHIAARGAFTNKDKSYAAAFTLDESLTDSARNTLTITSASLPWNHGTLSVRNVKIPLSGTAPVTIMVNVSGVSVDDMMQSLTGKRVTATGTVSGGIPVTIGRGGSFSLSTGSLKASGPGRIALPPDVIPGDNAQIALVRQLLQDLHYTDLQVALGTGDNGKLAVTMTVEGNNPAVYNGRPVKLNVHLGGDVLDLVRQNVILLTNPKQMLNQGE